MSRTASLAELRRARKNGYALVDQQLESVSARLRFRCASPMARVVAVNSGVQTSRVDRKAMVGDFLRSFKAPPRKSRLRSAMGSG